ncbi:hypothetical protein FQA39_LY15063 [Lamprigera yunnana]|nr:hypothetical protein FQA39_LY15063 [Lamprigera yunnana]
MKNINKELSKCKHPNSRKTKSLSKQAKRVILHNANNQAKNLKRSAIANKVQWFLNALNPTIAECTSEKTKDLIEKYLSRFDKELEQIRIKQSVGKRKNRQHASREDIIKLTIDRERQEYNSCGLEMPNVRDAAELATFRKWDGNLISLQHLKLTRISKKMLE